MAARRVASCGREIELVPTFEVQSGTPGTNDFTEVAACGETRRQADFAAAGFHRLAERGDGGFGAELRGSVNTLNQRKRYLLFRQPVGLTSKQNRLDLIQHAYMGMDGPRSSTINMGHSSGLRRHTSATLVIREMAKRKAFASDGSSGKGECLPGMADVV